MICEGCQHDKEKLIELCDECADKAANYDSCSWDRQYLIKAINLALVELRNAEHNTLPITRGRAIGILNTVLEYCMAASRE